MADGDKKPRADFVVRLVGEGIKPWAVPARVLSRINQATQRLIDQRDDSDTDDNQEARAGELAGTPTIQLLDIRAKSAGYGYATTDRDATINRLRLTGAGLLNPDEREWSEADLSSIKELCEVAKSLNCILEFREFYGGRRLGDIIAKITPTSFGHVSKSAYISGESSLFALVERAGGADAMRCGIRVPGQPRMVFCSVASEELVRELGRRIYEWVFIAGDFTWLRHQRRIKTVNIKSVKPRRSGSILSALDRIYEAGGSAWDTVEDPDTVLAEMRSGK